MKTRHIIIGKFLLFGLLLTACQQANQDKALRYLEKGYAQKDADNESAAMAAFKDAEYYGLRAGDSFTASRARYEIGDMLYRKGETKEEYIGRLKAADAGFGTHYGERAKLWNLMASAYMAFKEFDSAEMCLKQGLAYAERITDSTGRKVYRDDVPNDVVSQLITNHFVLYFDQGQFDKAAEYLWQFKARDGLNDDRTLRYYYSSLINNYRAAGNADSANYYCRLLEEMLPEMDTAQGAFSYWNYYELSTYAEEQGDYQSALEYYDKFVRGYARHNRKDERDNLYAVQRKYDFEVLRNDMNQKIIARQRWIIAVSILAALVLAALLVSQVKLARRRKREAEINAELFHFKQQNQALAQNAAEHELIQQDYANRLSEALDKEQQTMMLLDIYLKNNKKANLLSDLERSVFSDKDHWKAMLAVVEEKYPGLWETVEQKYPDLDEDEKKSFILSHFKVSRQEEADYLGTTVNMVDKTRGRVRKKMDAAQKK